MRLGPGLIGPSVPTPDKLFLLPAAGVFAKFVDESPAVHPLQDLPFVVVPGWTGAVRVPEAGTPWAAHALHLAPFPSGDLSHWLSTTNPHLPYFLELFFRNAERSRLGPMAALGLDLCSVCLVLPLLLSQGCVLGLS